jgi:hypothetical protein
LISVAVTLPETDPEKTTVPNWRKIIDYGLKHRMPLAQEAAAKAMGSVSKLVDSSSVVKR